MCFWLTFKWQISRLKQCISWHNMLKQLRKVLGYYIERFSFGMYDLKQWNFVHIPWVDDDIVLAIVLHVKQVIFLNRVWSFWYNYATMSSCCACIWNITYWEQWECNIPPIDPESYTNNIHLGDQWHKNLSEQQCRWLSLRSSSSTASAL